MSEENSTREKVRKPLPKKTLLLVILTGIAICIAIICFALVALLPPPAGPLLKDPLRSLLTGLGLLGVSCPLFIVGFRLEKRAAASPYYEEAFIATVFNIFGFLCLILGLICIGLSIYSLVNSLLGSG